MSPPVRRSKHGPNPRSSQAAEQSDSPAPRDQFTMNQPNSAARRPVQSLVRPPNTEMRRRPERRTIRSAALELDDSTRSRMGLPTRPNGATHRRDVSIVAGSAGLHPHAPPSRCRLPGSVPNASESEPSAADGAPRPHRPHSGCHHRCIAHPPVRCAQSSPDSAGSPSTATTDTARPPRPRRPQPKKFAGGRTTRFTGAARST
jgi:hypothetical protein